MSEAMPSSPVHDVLDAAPCVQGCEVTTTLVDGSDSGSAGIRTVTTKCTGGSGSSSAESPFLEPGAVDSMYQFGRSQSLSGSDSPSPSLRPQRNISFSETDSIRILQKSYANTGNKSFNSSMERSAESHDFWTSCYTLFFGALVGYFFVELTFMAVRPAESESISDLLPRAAVPLPTVAPPAAKVAPRSAPQGGGGVSIAAEEKAAPEEAKAADKTAVDTQAATENAAHVASVKKAAAEEAMRKAKAAEELAARAAAFAAEKKAAAMDAAKTAKEAERLARAA